MIALNIWLCKFVDAVVHTDTNKMDSANVANMIENVNAANTITQVFLDTIHGINSTEGSTVVEVPLLIGIKGLVVLKICSSKFTLKIKHQNFIPVCIMLIYTFMKKIKYQ